MKDPDKYEKVIELARRRGFFWPSYEIYGGVGGFIDFGPAGVALKRKIENKWRTFFLKKNDLLEIETPIITPRKVFEASGHIESFKDPLVECKSCARKYRVDHLLSEAGVQNTESMFLPQLDEELRKRNIKCPECEGTLLKPTYTQTMFKTTIGPYTDSIGYGRPEAAQGIFVNFKRLQEISREKFPIGIGQIGRALRNEISPRQGPIRLREFTIMEFEFFFDVDEPKCPRLHEVDNVEITILPLKSNTEKHNEIKKITIREAVEKRLILMEWMAYFMAISQQFIVELGIPASRQRFNEKLPTERAHYSAQTFDHEILFERWGWTEVAGHAYRTSYDLSKHTDYSGSDMRVFRSFDKPIEIEEKRLMPLAEAIRRDFKENSIKILELVKKVNLEKVEKSMLTYGYYKIDDFTLTKEHIKIQSFKKKETGKRIIPHVVEPSFGAERLTYATMEYAYSLKEDRVVLRLPNDLAPFQAVIMPLVSKEEILDKAKKVFQNIVNAKIEAYYDEVGSVGRRYARADEIGVPLAVTIDYETLNDSTVTVRERDSWQQTRVSEKELPGFIQKTTLAYN